MYDTGVTADAVFDVQAALVRQYVHGMRMPHDEELAAVLVVACSESLILPPGHVATVLDRIGYRETAQAYLKWAMDKHKASRKAGVNGRGEALRAKDKEIAENKNRLKVARGSG